jgi:hypothetical protein
MLDIQQLIDKIVDEDEVEIAFNRLILYLLVDYDDVKFIFLS